MRLSKSLTSPRSERHKNRKARTLARTEDYAIRSTTVIVAILVSWTVTTSGLPADAHETIGVVRTVEGSATVTRGNQALPATAGLKLMEGDILSTAAGGSLGVVLRDDSTISLGPGSTLLLRGFRFAPAAGNLGLLVRITRGTMAYLSGLIGKLAPETVRFETPTASIGIRGTRFAVKVGDRAPR